MLRLKQNATRSPLVLTWARADGTALDLTDLTVTGVLFDGFTRRDITGALALVTPESGIFSWDPSAADVATAGVFQVEFKAAASGGEYDLTYAALLTIDEAL